MIQNSFLSSSPQKGRGKKKYYLRCWITGVHNLKGCWQPLMVGTLFQKLWFQEWAKWVINATDSRKLGDEEHFRMFKCGRYDYSNQNPTPFHYSLSWTARLKKKRGKKKSYMILNCAVCINVRTSPDRSLHRQLTWKVTWYLSCFVLSTKKIPAAFSGEVSLLPYGVK